MVLDHQHEEYVIQMGLNDTCWHIIGLVLLMDPLPSINKIFALIRWEERHLGIISSAQLPMFESIGLSNGSVINALSVSQSSNKILTRKIGLYTGNVVKLDM